MIDTTGTMVKKTHVVKSVIEIDELKIGMRILEYQGLDVTYGSIDQNTCNFFKKNFKGTKGVILRHNRKLEIILDTLQSKDIILKIFDFPISIQKLTKVSDKLIEVLKGRRFFKFKVQYSVALPSGFKENMQDVWQLLKSNDTNTDTEQRPSVSSSKKITKPLTRAKKQFLLRKKRQATLENHANILVKNVNLSEKVRDEATGAVEFFMDSARKGKVNKDEIKSFVDKVAMKSSPEAIAAITNLKKSDQTYGHCVDVAALFHSIYFKLIKKNNRRSAFRYENEALLGGFMHDFGKSKIPKYIIDSTSKFSKDSDEMTIIKSHPKFGAKLLIDEMNMPSPVVNMALFHHVKHDINMSTSYPRNFDYSKVIYETRLLTIVDAYQALVGKRKYKRSWSPAAAMRYLEALSGIEFDADIWEDFRDVMGLYPKGTVVQLSDKSLGFVMSVPNKDLTKPTVAVFRNAYDQELDSNPLIDLHVNPNISIVKDMDQYDVFGSGSNALDKFKSINISS